MRRTISRWTGTNTPTAIDMITKISLSCKQCGKQFGAWPSQRRKFCSRKCYHLSLKGKSFFEVSEKERERRKKRMLGSNNPMWKGGDSDKERRNRDYKRWRIEVFERDGFTCQGCGYYNGCGKKRRDLNAHHIVGWTESIELRYEVENGMTLCVPCHIKEHTDKS